MMMVADTSASDKEIATLSKELAALGAATADNAGQCINDVVQEVFHFIT